MNIIEIRNLYKSYLSSQREGRVSVLRGLNLNIEAGKMTAIMGESGSGKSTLMNIIGTLDRPDSGSFRFNGRELANLKEGELAGIRSREISFIFQNSSLIPSLTALENVRLPLVYQRRRRGERNQAALAALRQVGLSDRLHHLPGELSGGQRQKAAIARAIAADPELILADEPTGALDSQSGAEVMEALQELCRKGKTVLLITHDRQIASCAERVLFLENGSLREF